MMPTDKYISEGFVNLFVARQYGPFMRRARSGNPSIEAVDDLFFNSCEAYYQKMINIVQRVLPQGMICVDVGCGTGRLVGEFARLGARLSVGIDASNIMLEMAAAVLRSPPEHNRSIRVPITRMGHTEFQLAGWGLNNVLLVRGNAGRLPIGDSAVDLVCCTNVLTRVSHPLAVIQELSRITRPGGLLLLSNDYDWSLQYSPREHWFEDVREHLSDSCWTVCKCEDDVAYTAWLHARKAIIARNQIVLARRRELGK